MEPITASAPGKMIVLGEHAVVYGKPAVALAIDRRLACSVTRGDGVILNNRPLNVEYHPHVKRILNSHGVTDINITMGSDIPSGAGLGSSAALSVAFSGAVRAFKGEQLDSVSVAKEAFDTEYDVQGRASPIDTSTSTNGGGVALNCPENIGKHLWTFERGDQRWGVSSIDVPKMTFVIGHTKIHALTGPLVEKVRRFRAKNKFAAEIVDDIGTVTLEGMESMRRNDLVGLGEAMTQDHKLLSILGVSGRELDKLVDASLEYSYGAKLTGSGGGGCMIALTDEPELVMEAIRLRGGVPYEVEAGTSGLTVNGSIIQ